MPLLLVDFHLRCSSVVHTHVRYTTGGSSKMQTQTSAHKIAARAIVGTNSPCPVGDATSSGELCYANEYQARTHGDGKSSHNCW